MNPPQTKRWRVLRRCLVGLAVILTLIGLFYTEENWRGKRAWDHCKRELEAHGVDFKWADYIPAPVPADENVFDVPEMQKWFVGRGATELSKKLAYPGNDSSNTARLTVAELTIGLPGASASSYSGAAVLHWGDPQAQAEAARLIQDALGPVAMHPLITTNNRLFMLRPPEEIRPAQIFLQCQTAPSAKELLEFLPKPIANTDFPDSEQIQVESAGDGSYKVTMLAPETVTAFLKWSGQFEPDFALIRKSLQRPYARMNGNYSEPFDIPIPNFVTIRNTGQTLAAMAQCHLLQGKPEEALRDLTLIHDLCRIMEGSRPMTLVSAMINVAVRGLYAKTIADGLRWQTWREPQLVTLEEQLQGINLLPPVKQAFEMERVSICRALEPATRPRPGKPFFKGSVLLSLIPRGWVYQNMVTIANRFPNTVASMDPASQIVFPDKVDALNEEALAISSHFSPYTFMAAMALPNYSHAIQTTARNQTTVHQALIVCALERYHLAHGAYPETLDALIPRFIAAIPHDVIGGQPPHYRRAADGTFALYSIGWSGQDKGGAPGKTMTEGDWVWPVFP